MHGTGVAPCDQVDIRISPSPTPSGSPPASRA